MRRDLRWIFKGWAMLAKCNYVIEDGWIVLFYSSADQCSDKSLKGAHGFDNKEMDMQVNIQQKLCDRYIVIIYRKLLNRGDPSFLGFHKNFDYLKS